MENHLHMIVSSPNLSKELGDFKSFTARKIIDRLQECGNNDLLTLLRLFKIRHKKECTYQIWQEGSHPEMIAGTEMLAQKIDYIHFNPVKRRFVELPEHWLYSSARNFAGLSGFIDITSLDELF
jgi:REP element-mobilizing transposase RayT